MVFRQAASMGRSANQAAGRFAGTVDDETGEVAARAAQVIALGVRVLRVPTAVLLVVPLPFILSFLVLTAQTSGAARIVFLVVGLGMAATSFAFWLRRHRILTAVEDPAALATELGILVSLSDKADETRRTLAQIAGGGGWQVMGRLKGLWSGATMTGHWIDGIGDLPRARYFAPPRIGSSVMLTIAALWLVPISVISTVFLAIGLLASTF